MGGEVQSLHATKADWIISSGRRDRELELWKQVGRDPSVHVEVSLV